VNETAEQGLLATLRLIHLFDSLRYNYLTMNRIYTIALLTIIDIKGIKVYVNKEFGCL